MVGCMAVNKHEDRSSHIHNYAHKHSSKDIQITTVTKTRKCTYLEASIYEQA